MLLPQIETERLRLRTYRTEDLETVFRLCSDENITRFFHENYSVSRADILASLPRRRNRWKTQGFGQLGVFEKQSENLVGFCGLQYLDKTSDVEVYYGFFKDFWGKGLATEAARAVLRFGFERANFDRVCAVTHPRNTASKKVLLKLGMTAREDERDFYGVKSAFYVLPRSDFKFGVSHYNLDYEQVEDLTADD